MKRKMTYDGQSEINRRMEKITLFAALIVITFTLILLCMIQASMLDNTWWIWLLVTQIALLVGCLVGLKWMRTGALISLCSAPFGICAFIMALSPSDISPLATFCMCGPLYGLLPLSIGLGQWGLAYIAHASSADSQPRQNSTDSITSLLNPLDCLFYPSSGGAGVDSSGGVDLGGGGIDTGGGIDLGSIDLNL
jgi:hypothetical protein